jgi:hypothetical protein
LRCMDSDTVFSVKEDIFSHEHHVWETPIWINIADRKLGETLAGNYFIKASKKVLATDKVLPNNLNPCKIKVEKRGLFSFSETKGKSNFSIFYRGDIKGNEKALRTALPNLYLSFKPYLL